MGLSSVFNTAITGLQAAETTIDVSGNNVANSNTIGFKASEALFSNQFLQTLSLGSAPTGTNGGTNPRQVGLGTQVAAIRTQFTQGTIAISANPSDLAMQGDGFFVVQATGGEQLYTRNGKFALNSQSELVTTNGDRLLGFGVDDNFQLQSTTLQSLKIPLGSAAVAKATENVYMEGTLTPTGDLADLGEIIQSRRFSDGAKGVPTDLPANSISAVNSPSVVGVTSTTADTVPGAVPSGSYRYKVVFVDANGNEGARDFTPFRVTVVAHGPHLATWVDGYQTADWTDTRPPHANPRMGLRLEPGTIQLQAHDPATDMEFHGVWLQELPAKRSAENTKGDRGD